MTEEKQKNKRSWIIPVVLLIAVVAIIIVVFLMMRGTETRESGNKENYSITALACESSSPNDAFFSLNTAISNEHTIKITFKDEKADKIAYNYVGEFEAEDGAEQASSSLHAKYNIDMGDHGLDPESLTPVFTPDKKVLRINLYADVNNLNATTAKFFFLTVDEQRNIKTYSEKTIQKIYENVGFKCKKIN